MRTYRQIQLYRKQYQQRPEVKKHRNEYMKKWNKKNPIRAKMVRDRKWAKLRLLILQRIGGKLPKCACCGETNLIFLAIDHIKNTGWRDRKRGLTGSAFYWSLKRKKLLKDFQILCHNCNWAKSHGGCPHQK